LFKEVEGLPLFSAAPGHALGEGLKMARGQGGQVAGRGLFLPSFGGLPESEDPHRARWNERPLPVSADHPLHEIYVNRIGWRFVAEDEESLEVKAKALLKGDDLTFFAIFDEEAVRKQGGMVTGWSADQLRERAGRQEGVHTAPTLESLAESAGITVENLTTTISRYNTFVENANDRDFGRKALPAPIARPPFYALRHHGTALVSCAGVDVDERLRLRDEDGGVVEGLYAVGEILGAGATRGQSLEDGMVLGPAIILGRSLGERLGRPVDKPNDPTAEILRPA